MNQAERIALVGGTVITCDDRDTTAGGVYVENGRISRVGSAQDILTHLPPETTVVDISGKTLTPGFMDAHNHLTLQGAALGAVRFNFPEVASIEDLVRAVARGAEQTPEGRWIRGWGMDYDKYPDGRRPTRWDIDPVSKDHPVCIVHYTGHFVLVNSVALKMAGIDDRVTDPVGGKFVRDDRGRLTGLVLDCAQQLVVPSRVQVGHHGPDIGYDTPLDELVDDIERACLAYHRAGITSVVDPQVTTREAAGYFEAKRRGRLKVKTTLMYMSNHLPAIKELGLFAPIGDQWLSIGPIKYYCDGALVGGTAAFHEPLAYAPDTYGYTYWEEEALRASLIETHGTGLQFGIHAQGDRAIGMVLNSVEEAIRRVPRSDHRHRIEHFGGPTVEQVERAARLGVIPITQPGQLFEAGDDLIHNYGEARAQRLYPLRSMLDAGIPAVISTDAFVQSYKPLDCIRGAVNRTSWRGQDMGQGERISVKEAIRAYTISAARASFQEADRGSIEPGKAADLTLIGGDILNVPTDQIAELSIDLTMIDGHIVHQANI